jgi:glycosyltransferase involved in cell wall biosynthesis
MFHDWAVWRECHRAGVPYIVQPHGSLDPFIFRHHRWRKAISEKLFQNQVMRDAAFVHFTSYEERDLAQPYIFGRPSVVIPLGVNLEEVANLPPAVGFRQHYPEIGDRRIVLFLGRINFKKGFEILIPAFAAALKRNPDLHLVVVGADGGHRRETLQLIRANAVSDRVTLTGHLDRAGVVEAYAAADVFVLPSYTENFGIAAAEAMTAGVPSILSDKVQIAGLAAQHKACWMVPLTVADWTGAILHAVSATGEANAMRQRAREWTREYFTWSTVAQKLVATYQAIAAAASSPLREVEIARPVTKSSSPIEVFRTKNSVRAGASGEELDHPALQSPISPSPRKMRIIHVISTLSPLAGGTSVACVGTAKAVAALGHEVTIHTTDHGMAPHALPAFETVGKGELRIVVHRHVPPGSLFRHASIGMWRALASEIPQSDVVRLHSLYMFHDWVVWRECRRAGIPYILQPHGALDPFIFRHHRWRKAIIEQLIQNRVTRDAALVYFTSEGERRLAQPHIFGRPSIAIPLGIDLDEVTNLPPATVFRQHHPEIGDRRIVLSLGRINFKKGFEILIPAFAAALKQDPDLHLVIAGPHEAWAARLHMLVRAWAISDHVTFTGLLDRCSVMEAYAAADLFVMPSHTENFGIAAAEAISAGVPSILSDNVQIARLAVQHNACWMVPLVISEWTDAILHALSSPDEARNVGEAGKQWSKRAFAWPEKAQQLVRLYEGLATSHRPSKWH